jgi:hypothetical protein
VTAQRKPLFNLTGQPYRVGSHRQPPLSARSASQQLHNKPCSKSPLRSSYREKIHGFDGASKLDGYDLLRDYLQRQHLPEIVLTFDAIEEILGFALPRASLRASWWEKERNPENARPQRDAIRDGGYEATRLPNDKGVRFRKLSAGRFIPKH